LKSQRDKLSSSLINLKKKLAKEDLQSLNLENKLDRLIATSSCIQRSTQIVRLDAHLFFYFFVPMQWSLIIEKIEKEKASLAGKMMKSGSKVSRVRYQNRSSARVLSNFLGAIMPKIKDLMTKNVITIDGQKTVFEAAELMGQKEVGDLIVMDGKMPIGIVTERDFVRRVVAKRSPFESKSQR
jgi:hypothetical protein